MSSSGLDLLLISDIHAFSGDPRTDEAPSYFSTWPLWNASPQKNPFLSIPEILKERDLNVDWVLCGGDLADRADPTGQAIAWGALRELKEKVGASLLLGAVGNHDVDSRLKFDEIDTKGTLQSLTPFFPGLDERECDFFWSRNFVILDTKDIVLVLLNSAAFHGIDTSNRSPSYQEYEHGRVSNRTIDAIIAKLPATPRKLHILLTHHHFLENERVSGSEASAIINGGKLLAKLQDKTKTSWLVLHGHQHYPNITYGLGDPNPPVIFSAGSFSRKLNELANESSNQFYHINLPTDRYAEIGWQACGVCHAWDWIPDDGWKPARGIARIPHRAGFGCRNSPENFAKQIASIVRAAPKRMLQWEDVALKVPELSFVLPTTLEALKAKLGDLGIKVWGRPFIEPCQVAED